MNISIFNLLSRLWFQINHRRKIQLRLLFLLMIFTSLSEVISIGSIMPFIALLSNPDSINNFFPVGSINISKNDNLLQFATIFFCVAIAFSSILRLLLIWSNMKLSYAIGADISSAIYKKSLYQRYSVHISRNSGDIISAISSKTIDVITTLSSTLTILSASVMVFTILLTLFFINQLVTTIVFVTLSFIYFLIIIVTRKYLIRNSVITAESSSNVIKILQEGLGGIRDIILDGSQEHYCKEYRFADANLRRAQGNTQFIGQSPRVVIEGVGMIFISLLAYKLVDSGGLDDALPILGVLALGSQRLLPLLQNMYLCWSNIQGNRSSLSDALKLLEQPLPEALNSDQQQKITFKEEITLQNINFQYCKNSPLVLNNINLSIRKGARIGVIGSTGGGKSTLLDLIMGLLEPSSGQIKIDNRVIAGSDLLSWQKNIAHVPQSIYLADKSIAENIAFGMAANKINTSKIIAAATKANIHDFISSLPGGYNHPVGERGVRLSGGQRQRIGIARALYKEAEVIVFDEATSALDITTELEVMNAIDQFDKNLTLIMVAHRITTLKNCELIIEIVSGRVNRVCDYHTLISERKYI